MIVRKRELVEMLEELAQLVKDDDSFEGTISYTCMKDGLEAGEFEVSAAFRHGNSQGQGGMAIIEGNVG